MSQETPYVLDVEGVYKSYGDRERMKTILNDVNFRVRQGEFVTVVGTTGCGKSTLLRLILGSEQPSVGHVRIGGESPDGADRTRGIVFQRYSLFPHLTVLKNIAFGMELDYFNLFQRTVIPFAYRKKLREFEERARELIGNIGLKPADADKYPHQLSGGMQQRVAIAQALAMRPTILLMDEPFGALDDATRQMMQFFILEQWKKWNMTVFFVTHDLEEALFLGTRIIVLSQFYAAPQEGMEGAKIVIDKAVPEASAHSTDFKYTKEFSELLHQIRADGLDPTHRKPIAEFDLSHPDAGRPQALPLVAAKIGG